jgi:putative ABC transport system ATP-binding protein
VIELRGVQFAYRGGNFQLDIPSFRVQSGERLAVIGPSGSGKTTLLNLIAGILIPVRGNVEVDGTEVSVLGDARRRDFRIRNIGFVFQDFELLDYLNVLDNILHPYRISALRLDRTVRERAEGLAERLEVGDKLIHRADDLSQGEKQRVAICRALLPGPPADPRRRGHRQSRPAQQGTHTRPAVRQCRGPRRNPARGDPRPRTAPPV